MKPKIVTIIGARPQFIKAAALSPILRKSFDEILIHTGQHYDLNMSEIFFEEFKLPTPNYHLGVGSMKSTIQIAEMIKGIDEILIIEQPSHVLVMGDTNSTLAGTIATIKNNIGLSHIEAGLRSYVKNMPEEQNRVLTTVMADLLFCPTKKAVDVVRNMGVKENIYNVGDVMMDLIKKNENRITTNIPITLKKYGVENNGYLFLTIHRAVNTDSKNRIERILRVVSNTGMKVIFPIHPRTKKSIESNKLNRYLENENIITTNPLDWLSTQSLISASKFVLTDSGGVTREAYFHHKPGLLLNSQTEWTETVEEGWNTVCDINEDLILKTLSSWATPATHTNCLGNGDAASKILNILENKLC